MTNKRPSFQFYPADWRKDPAVQALNYHDRGVWFELICLMHESDERGVLLLNGKPMPTEALSNLLKIDEILLNQILSKFIEYGVAKVRECDGALYNKRMVEDEKLSQTRAESGKKGGNPSLLNQNQSKTKAKSKQSNNQMPTPSSSSSSSSSDIDDNDSNESSSSAVVDDFFENSENQQPVQEPPPDVAKIIRDVIQTRIDSGLEVRNRQGMAVALSRQYAKNPECVNEWNAFLDEHKAKKQQNEDKIIAIQTEKMQKQRDDEERDRLKRCRHHWNAVFKKMPEGEDRARIEDRALKECERMPNGDPLMVHLSELIAKYTEEYHER